MRRRLVDGSQLLEYAVLLVLITQIRGWTELVVDTNAGNKETEFLDFSSTKNRVQLELAQLDDDSDLEFKIETSFFIQDLQGSLVATIGYNWNTHSGRKNGLSLYDASEFEICAESNSNMLNNIPTVVTMDLNTGYLVEIQDGSQGTFSTATDEPCPTVWTSFKNSRASITKVKIKLIDEDAGYKLENKFMIKYRVIAACDAGQFLGNNGCENCAADHYGAGGWLTSCSQCPSGKGVEAGKGIQESDCTWKPCTGGHYLNDQTGCLTCETGYYSAGGTVSECTKCDADNYSEAGATQCTDCPSGKGVASGEGKQESDCKAKDLEPEDKEKAGDKADEPEKAGEVENENADEAEDENNDCDCADSGTERIFDRTAKLFVAFIIFLGGQHSS